MASTYTTIQGDTWDLIAYKLYGEEKYMKNLIEANCPMRSQMAVFRAWRKRLEMFWPTA